MVSNGPYVLKERRPNGFVRLEKNARFYDEGQVRIDTVVYYPTVDPNAALLRFRDGELDSNNDIPLDRFESLRTQQPGQVVVTPKLQTRYIGFNTKARVFADHRVRQALTMAVDRQRLAQDIMRGLYLPTEAFVPPGIANYPGSTLPSWTSSSMAARAARARALLRSAGYEAGRPLRFTYRIGSGADARRRAVALAAMWREVGVEAEILATEPTTHDAAVRAGDFEAAELAWTADYNDPLTYLFLLDSHTGPLNATRYANPDFDALLGRARAVGDLRERGALLARAEAVGLEEAPIAPILTGTSRLLIAPYLKGLQPNPVGRFATRFMWIDPTLRSTK
jgi:oligopeptide transport system substrate-binding protein